ncbi:MAG: hypothetical protein PHN25_06080 [Tissierellia bacterium]|nr:hypothetical protein [Tissierellia bacterium]MDD3751757.1 hypothetical protein [Tissierellia bacterium]MDD4047134.1 hypothetical protein [Tissierellia bacterium]MDD4678748.1 hypothetical protein [Tissierellia bacterium]
MIDLTEYLKFKERQSIWCKINESEKEYISKDERKLDELKSSSEFISQEELLKELNIKDDEI